jgi:diguanylate cyclase (GGDEF)-like protein
MRPPAQWRYSYIVSCVAGLAALYIVSLIINWLGQIQHQHATTDALTGIANRHLLSDLLTQHGERVAMQHQRPVVMLIDIDHFKSINDSYGHAMGDHVLTDVAATIMQHIRGVDHVGRWGGDEFLVLLTDMSLSAAQEVAERIRAAIEQCVFGDAVRTTVTIGIHRYRVGQSIEEALVCADQALYAAKHAGRNQVCVQESG